MDFVDDEEEPDPEFRRLTNVIIGAAIAVHRQRGPGHAESVYVKALELEFKARGIRAQREYRFELTYLGEVVGTGRVDFLVEDTVVVETKSVEALSSLHTAQVIAYLRATHRRLALLINFNVKMLKDGIRRISV